MSNLALRILTAAVLIPVVGVLVAWRQPWGWGAFVILVVAACLVEYAVMMLRDRPAGERGAVVAVGVALACGVYLAPDQALGLVAGAIVLLGLAFLVRPGDIETVGARLGKAAFGVFYVGLLTPTIALLQRDVPHGRRWVVLAMGVTFANDIGAYFTGRAIGRHKLYPVISPSKTVEGGVGGLAGSLGFALAARATFFPTLTIADCLLCALPAAVLGPAGDLVESMLKRSAGVKDSGRLLPGHGGMLDRIDALLFVTPWIYLYATLLR